MLFSGFAFVSECEKGKSALQVLCTNTGRNTFYLKILTPNYKHHMRWNILQNFDCTCIPPSRPSFKSFFPSQPFQIALLLIFFFLSLKSSLFISHFFHSSLSSVFLYLFSLGPTVGFCTREHNDCSAWRLIGKSVSEWVRNRFASTN
jgi:hypothetical protein